MSDRGAGSARDAGAVRGLPAHRLPPAAVWAAACVAIIAAVAIVDEALNRHTIITTLVIAGPLLAAVRLRWQATLAIGLLAVGVVLASGLWNHYFAQREHVVRVLITIVGAGLAVALSVVRTRLADEAHEKAALAAAAERARAELDALYATMPVGLAFLDPGLRFTRVNEALARLDGLPVSAHLGRRIDEALPQIDRDSVARMERVLASGEAVERDVHGPDPSASGHERTFRVAYYPVMDEQAETLGVGALVRETTADVRREGALEMLAETGRLLDRPLEVENRLAALAEMLMPALGDACIVHVIAERRGSSPPAVVAAGITQRLDAAARSLARRELDLRGDAPSARAIRAQRPVTFDARDMGDIEGPSPPAEAGVRAGVSVPMSGTTGVLGALTLLSTTREAYDDDDIRLIAIVARRAALTIDNARRYQEQAHVAAALQTELLPPGPPEWDDVDVAALYRPAEGEAEVGGDFYDFAAPGDGVRTVTIGDVSGKGVEAAALTAIARMALRIALRDGAEPAEALEHVNRALVEDSTSDLFCTLAHCTLGREPDGALGVEVICAGHPPPVIRRADGRTEELGVPGTLLGAFPEIDVRPARSRLEPGDALVLFTDGLTEARGGDGFIGERGVRALLAVPGSPTAAELVGRLEAATGDAGAGRDDLAIVVVMACG